VTGDFAWAWSDKGAQNEYAVMSGFDSAVFKAFVNDDWLINRIALDLSSFTSGSLNFQTAMNYDDSGSGLSILVSKDYPGDGNPLDFSWDDLTTQATLASPGWTWTSSGSIDLSAYCGSTLYIAFRYKSTTSASDTWEVDNVEVLASQ